MADAGGFVHLESGRSRATISLFGATVTSYIGEDGVDRLWRSSTSPLDKAGPSCMCAGIPIVWPVFGEPPSEGQFGKLRLHGFAMRFHWKLLDKTDDASARFFLEPNDDIRKMYEPDFRLEYTVKLSQERLECSLTVINPDSASVPLEFHALFHNYFHLPEGVMPKDVVVRKSLQGRKYIDKINNFEHRTLEQPDFAWDGPTDNVWFTKPDKVEAVFGQSGRGVRIETENLVNLTTWNPGMSLNKDWPEFEEYGWKHFVCIEPGSVVDLISIKPGHRWTGAQSIYGN